MIDITRQKLSAGECYLHTVEVTGSNPVPPTITKTGSCAIPACIRFSIMRHLIHSETIVTEKIRELSGSVIKMEVRE